MFPYCPNILLITAAAERRGIKPYRLTPNKNWLLSYQELYGALPVPAWVVSTPFVKKNIELLGINKVLQALETAKKDKLYLESGYTLKMIMSPNIISRLVNQPSPEKNLEISRLSTNRLLEEMAKAREQSITEGSFVDELKKIARRENHD
jgi:hypothetical protein